MPRRSVDLATLPTFYAVAYQKWSSGKAFYVAHAALALALSLIGEPIAIWANIYQPIDWNRLLSLPIYFLLPVAARFLTHGVFKKQDWSRPPWQPPQT